MNGLSFCFNRSSTIGGVGNVPMCVRMERRALRHAGHGLAGGSSGNVVGDPVFGQVPGTSLLKNIQHSVSGLLERSTNAMAKHVPRFWDSPLLRTLPSSEGGNVARTWDEELLCSNCNRRYNGNE